MNSDSTAEGDAVISEAALSALLTSLSTKVKEDSSAIDAIKRLTTECSRLSKAHKKMGQEISAKNHTIAMYEKARREGNAKSYDNKTTQVDSSCFLEAVPGSSNGPQPKSRDVMPFEASLEVKKERMEATVIDKVTGLKRKGMPLDCSGVLVVVKPEPSGSVTSLSRDRKSLILQPTAHSFDALEISDDDDLQVIDESGASLPRLQLPPEFANHSEEVRLSLHKNLYAAHQNSAVKREASTTDGKS
jgi:hypothetical protein